MASEIAKKKTIGFAKQNASYICLVSSENVGARNCVQIGITFLPTTTTNNFITKKRKKERKRKQNKIKLSTCDNL